MKTKTLLTVTLICIIFSMSGFKAKKDTQYFVAYGWENINYCNNKSLGTAWVYSNVVKVSCDYISSQGVFNQFNDHYTSIYGRTRCRNIVGSYATGFNTYDEAAAYRRKLVADAQSRQDNPPILINNFSYYCD